MSLLDAQLFRAFDIRGHESRFPDAGVRALGRALGAELGARGGRRLVVGRDGRIDSDRLHRALFAGLLESGVHVLDLGRVPTPLTYFAVHHLAADGAVQITGSHLPPRHNGFKIAFGTSTIAGPDLQRLRERLLEAAPERRSGTQAVGMQAVRTQETEPVDEAHLRYCLARLRPPSRRLRVVVDGGEGVGGWHAVSLLRQLGCEVVPVSCDPDGAFPSRGPEPSPEKLGLLRETVASTGADLGVALDGDADRLVAMDETGEVVDGDRLLLLFARAVLREHPGAAVVGEVKCSQVLFDDVLVHGGRPVMAPVGHAFVREAMRREGALLGGELSGHFYFADRHWGFDDAFFAAGRLVELIGGGQASLSERLSALPRRATSPEESLSLARHLAPRLVEAVANRFREGHRICDVDGARITFEDGWALVRASQTSDAVGLRYESATPEGLEAIRQRVRAVVREVAEALGASNTSNASNPL